MSKTEHEGLGPRLERQLRAALDGVEPLNSPPRYQQEDAAPARRSAFAPTVFAAGVAGALVLTLLAAASSRSFDLQHRIVNTIQSRPAPAPSPVQAPTTTTFIAQQPAPAPQSSQHAQPTRVPEPPQSSEPAQSPGPGESQPGQSSPEPSHDRSHPSPSPPPSDH